MTVRNKNPQENMRHSNSWPDRAVTVKVRVDPVSRAYTIIPAFLENSLVRITTKKIPKSDQCQGVQHVHDISGLNNEYDIDCIAWDQKKERCIKENTTRSIKEEKKEEELVAASFSNQAEPKKSKSSSITCSLDKENTLLSHTEKCNDFSQETNTNRIIASNSLPFLTYNQTSKWKWPNPKENRHSWNSLRTISEEKRNVYRVKSLPNNFRGSSKTPIRLKLEEKSLRGSLSVFEANSFSKEKITRILKSRSDQEMTISSERTPFFGKCNNPG